jgi:ribosome-associated protein
MDVKISITDEFITLGELLKYSGFTITGGEAKTMIKEGIVLVNDEVELRRGRKIYKGDKVSLEMGNIDVC